MILGLTGKARSGKDTVASIIEDEVSGVVRKVGFADLLKLSAARSLNVLTNPDDVGIEAVRSWSDALKTRYRIDIVDEETGDRVHSLTGRKFLQRYGTEAHRELFGDDFWVEAVDLNPPGVDVLIVNDVRFPNEAEAIKRAGGQVWQVERGGAKAVENHATEQPLPPHLVDRVIPNHRTVTDLRAFLVFFMADVVVTESRV